MAKIKFEDTFKQLEDIVEKLEQGNLSLDETLLEYEKGIKVYKKCISLLNEAEKKIQILLKDENGILQAKNFEHEETQGDNLP